MNCRFNLSLGIFCLILAGCNRPDPQVEKAREAVIILARSQQAYYVEQGQFTDQLNALSIDWLKLQETTPKYAYAMNLVSDKKNLVGVEVFGVGLRGRRTGFFGLVWIDKEAKNFPFETILCQGNKPLPLGKTTLSTKNSCPPEMQPYEPVSF